MRVSRGEERFEQYVLSSMDAAGWPPCVRQHRPVPERRWRIDFAWPDRLLGVEVQGLRPGAGGAHQRLLPVLRESERNLWLAREGWQLLQVPALFLAPGSKHQRIEFVIETVSLLLVSRKVF